MCAFTNTTVALFTDSLLLDVLGLEQGYFHSIDVICDYSHHVQIDAISIEELDLLCVAFSPSFKSTTYDPSGTKFLTAFQYHQENGLTSMNSKKRCGRPSSSFVFIPNLGDNRPTTLLRSSSAEGGAQ